MAEQTARPTAVFVRAPALVLRKRLVLPILGGAGLLATLSVGTGYGYAPGSSLEPAKAAFPLPSDPGEARKALAAIEKEDRAVRAKLAKLAPKGHYLVIDQTRNRLYIKKDGQVVREAICSAGSGMVLQTHDATRKWVFDTPRRDEINDDTTSGSSGNGAIGAPVPSAPDRALEGAQMETVLAKAISELDDEQRTVIILRDVEDLSIEEICAITELPDGTVKSRLHCARLALRKKLLRQGIGHGAGQDTGDA